MLKDILKNLDLPEKAIEAYIILLETGSLSARQLANKLSIPRPSIYNYLNLLKTEGLVWENQTDNKNLFGISDIQNLQRRLREKAGAILQTEQELIKILPSIKKRNAVEPKIQIYSGREGVKKALNELFWCENIETYTMWPISNMIEILGEDFLERLNRSRIKNNVSVKALWPTDKKVKLKDYPFLGVGKKHLRELRITPKQLSWNMSYWIYGDKVAFVSSDQELFGFIVQSQDFVDMLKSQFNLIWQISAPVKPEPKHTDIFLKNI
jgi:sugar-specific transcriptional regulator TrmB